MKGHNPMEEEPIWLKEAKAAEERDDLSFKEYKEMKKVRLAKSYEASFKKASALMEGFDLLKKEVPSFNYTPQKHMDGSIRLETTLEQPFGKHNGLYEDYVTVIATPSGLSCILRDEKAQEERPDPMTEEEVLSEIMQMISDEPTFAEREVKEERAILAEISTMAHAQAKKKAPRP